ncbi:tetratricopeptide repeat protein [Jiella sonneratiae]|uniref:Tetratricopeptide repeat protein n=1 Tax=Jiella sonneratiae TaxID=2816856 RepID=A0ABS3IXK5_9HYPH|nr:tetratricopeptide repeat protein [Jiella sonneratiae]MBO0902149.1 tetratricopeptide repeat protein [Jiella sonneratiae]
MSDDSFFREVDEELRQDKVKAVWTRFGAWLLGGAVAVVAVTAGVVAWEHYQTGQANAAGDRYAAAVKLAADGKNDEAVKALKAIAADGTGAYPYLAELSLGGIEAAAGHPKEAVAAFDGVANAGEAPQGLRDMAAIRAAYVLVDSGTLDEVRQRVERLSGDSDTLRFPAREAIALAAWKAGDGETAKPLFQQLVTDPGTPSDISGRAKIMLDLINSGATGPNALPPAKPDGTAAKAPAASADNGLGAVDLPGLLDTGGDAGAGAGDAGPADGGAAMPTTDLGTATGANAASDASATDGAAAGATSSPGPETAAPAATDAPAGPGTAGEAAGDQPAAAGDAGAAPATTGDAAAGQAAPDGDSPANGQAASTTGTTTGNAADQPRPPLDGQNSN